MSGPNGRRLTRARIAGMIAYLMAAPRTKRAVARHVGASRTCTNDWVNVLHKAGCLHVCGYVRTLAGPVTTVYRWGSGDDAVKPAPRTSAQRTAKSRDRSTLDRAWRVSSST